jgi:hypothetical protein
MFLRYLALADEPMSTEDFMQKIDTEWLRDHMRKFIGKSSEADLSANALQSDLAKNSEQILALRVNELLDGKNKHFAETQAECIVEQAIEYLKIAREKVDSAELARCAAEAELGRYRDQVKSQIGIKIRAIQEQMDLAASQLASAEQRARVAEERAIKAETSVRRLEDELQTQMMRARPRLVRIAA